MSSNIPTVQAAAIVQSAGSPLILNTSHPVRQPSDLEPGECLVKISHTGVCHTDLHAKQGDWPIPAIYPLVGGHEGVGEVVAIGQYTEGSPVKVGDRVGIKWLAYSCLDCEFCGKGFEMNCQKCKLSGYTTDGTFSQYVVSFVHHVTPIPKELPSADAASILCAGVTTYKALKVSNTHVGEWVVILGAGGGLGHLAVQYAKAMGLKVIGIDSGVSKQKLVQSLGVDAWIDFRETEDLIEDIRKVTPGGLGPHAAIVAAANQTAYTQAIEYLRPTGTLVVVGMPDASIGANAFWTVFKSIRIQGSYVGNRQDAIEALQLAADGKVKVNFELRKINDLTDVFESMEEGKIAGRIVLEMD